jgi:hypothetical protein
VLEQRFDPGDSLEVRENGQFQRKSQLPDDSSSTYLRHPLIQGTDDP